ncbi:hypothetical protein HFP15_31215 [Amycolatopsis sp. K13G38]|uniref:DUF7847 domain-containing protein n=1 Tax=Amycolatopsis acididurans TaxID=2724524 RepID=A0ABX1JCA1_9PSEU|nr:hypothetical protein [Amycolatopsis acididurans]NKQ57344.1 hypothetical protein [Amycolatopsis acididurans]
MTDDSGWTNPEQPRRDLPPAPPPGPDPRFGHGKPGVIPLRPLSVGEILDGSVTTMRRHPALVFGVSAVVAVISAALSLGANYLFLRNTPLPQPPGPAASQQEAMNYLSDVLRQTSTSLGVAAVILVITQTFLTGFMTVVAGKAVLGRPVTLREALGELWPRFLPLLGVTIVYTIIVAVASIFFIIPGIWLYVLFGLAAPALVLERGGIGTSLRRSRLLVQGMWWRVFGVMLLTTIASGIISFVIQIPFNLQTGIGSGGAELAGQSIGTQLLSALGTVIADTVVTPFVAGATVLLYIDQRMRKEGMDIQLARAAAE